MILRESSRAAVTSVQIKIKYVHPNCQGLHFGIFIILSRMFSKLQLKRFILFQNKMCFDLASLFTV